MKIIYGDNRSTVTEHAATVVKKIQQQEADPSYPKHAMPIGIAHHLALYPKACDECGVTYWSKDEWGSHIGCRGYVRGETGFA